MARSNNYDELDEMLMPQTPDMPDTEGEEESPIQKQGKAPAKKSKTASVAKKSSKGRNTALVIGGVAISTTVIVTVLACVAAFALLIGGMVWVGLAMGDRAGVGNGDDPVAVQKADPEPGRTYFKSDVQPELSSEGVKGRLKEVYYTKDGGLGVTLRLSNGTSSEHKLVSVNIRIFNDKDETIAYEKIDSFKPVCKVPAGGYTDVYFTMSKNSVQIADDSLNTLGTTLEIGSQPTGGGQKQESDGKGPKDIAPNRTYFEATANIPELSAEGVKASVVRARYTNDGSLSVSVSFSNGTDMRQKVSMVDLLIQNGNGETVGKQVFDNLDPECIVEKQSYTEYELIIDVQNVPLQNDPLSTLSCTVSVSAAGVD